MPIDSSLRLWVVVPAAGTGSRMGAEIPKQYLKIGGRCVLEWTLGALAAVPAQGTVLALSPDDDQWATLQFPSKQGVRTVEGGGERADSVFNALTALRGEATDDDFVLVHDAARPCLSRACLDRLLHELRDHPVGGLLAVPVADTLKAVDDERNVRETRDRNGLWQAQTPQMFRFGLLYGAMEAALSGDRARLTDEAAAMELQGHVPRVVEGSCMNLKITHFTDLELAGRILCGGGAN